MNCLSYHDNEPIIIDYHQCIESHCIFQIMKRMEGGGGGRQQQTKEMVIMTFVYFNLLLQGGTHFAVVVSMYVETDEAHLKAVKKLKKNIREYATSQYEQCIK